MYRSFLIGKRLYLRRFEERDLNETYLGWLNDRVVTQYLEAGRFPASLEGMKSLWESYEKSLTDLLFAMVLTDGDHYIGTVTLNRINWVHGTADTGLMIGEKDCWGQGYAFEAWSLVIDYAFRRLGLRKIIAGAIADNTASLATLKKLGFQEEGRLRQEFWVEGRYRDAVRLGLFGPEFYKHVPAAEPTATNRTGA